MKIFDIHTGVGYVIKTKYGTYLNQYASQFMTKMQAQCSLEKLKRLYPGPFEDAKIVAIRVEEVDEIESYYGGRIRENY